MHLSQAAARALMVAAQGLHCRPDAAASKADLLLSPIRANLPHITSA